MYLLYLTVQTTSFSPLQSTQRDIEFLAKFALLGSLSDLKDFFYTEEEWGSVATPIAVSFSQSKVGWKHN